MNKISLIIPVYNTEKYLEKCIESACVQTYSNLEILCIDDGSTDNSGTILDEFAAKDARIIAVHKENAGESSARNVGLHMCTGDYIAFMDCDDWIEKDMYETLIKEMVNERVDLVASGWYMDTESNSEEIGNQLPVSEAVFDRTQLMEYVYRRDAYKGFAYMWNKLYRRELFYEDGNMFFFDENLTLGGDVLMLSRLVSNARHAKYVKKAFYHYVQRQESGCHTINLNKRMDWLLAYKHVLKDYNEKGVDTGILTWIKRFMAYHSSNVAELAYAQKNKNILMESQEIMRFYQYEYETTNREHTRRLDRYADILNYKLG